MRSLIWTNTEKKNYIRQSMMRASCACVVLCYMRLNMCMYVWYGKHMCVFVNIANFSHYYLSVVGTKYLFLQFTILVVSINMRVLYIDITNMLLCYDADTVYVSYMHFRQNHYTFFFFFFFLKTISLWIL